MRNLVSWITYSVIGILIIIGLANFSGILDGVWDSDDSAPSTSLGESTSTDEPETDTTIAPSDDRPVPYFDIVRVERDGSVVVSGHSHSESVVDLLLGDGSVIGTVDALLNGDFVIIPEPFGPGDYVLALRSMHDGEVTFSSEIATIHIPSSSSDDVVILVSREGEASRILSGLSSLPISDSDSATTTDSTDSATTTDTASVSPDLPSPIDFAVEAVEIEGAEIFVAGSVPSGSSVRIYVDTDFLGLVRGTPDDRFLLSTPYILSPGSHTIRADMIDLTDGSVISRVEVPLFHYPAGSESATASDDTTSSTDSSASIRTGTTIIIKWGDTLWDLSRAQYGDGFRYTTIFRANSDQIRDPNLIYVGQIFSIPDEPDPESDSTESQ